TYTSNDVGTEQFYVAVKTHNVMETAASSNTVSVTVADTVPSCTAVKLTSPVMNASGTAATPFTLTAVATCPPGTTPEYQYWVKTSSATSYTILGGFVSG